MPTIDDGIDDKFRSVTADDVHDGALVAGQLRALQREVRDGFESIARSLAAFTRIEARLDVIIDRQNVSDSRMDAVERRIAALETKRRKPAGKR